MMNMNRRGLLTLLGSSAETPPANKFKSIPPRERIRQRYFPDLVLTTHEGRNVRLYEDLIKDKIVLINFMYAKCEGICLPVTANLVKVQKLFGDRMGKDVFINSFTLKPEQDTVEELKHYADMYKIGPGWSFITGAPADMETIRRKLGFVDPDPVLDRDKSNHIGNIAYGNEPMSRWGGAPGTSNPDWIVKMVSWVDWPKNNGKGERI